MTAISRSELIRDCRDGVVANPYQSEDKKVVFVCSMGILRSATASRLYGKKYNTRSAGTWEGHALIELTQLLIDWADELVFVNSANFDRATEKFGHAWHTKAKVLNIPDAFDHMSPELIKEFEEQYEPVDA